MRMPISMNTCECRGNPDKTGYSGNMGNRCIYIYIYIYIYIIYIYIYISAGSIYRSIAILAKVRSPYLVVSRYFDIVGIERPLFDTFDTFDTFDISILDIESI